MAMLQAGRVFHVVEVVLRDKPPEMLALSPKGTVPVLHTPDGLVLEESWDIMQWALASGKHEGWWRLAQSTQNLDLLQINDGDFKQCLDRYKYPDRYPAETRPRAALRAHAVAALLAPLEARLQQHPWLGGTAPCATDLAIFPFVRQFAGVEPEWFAEQGLPALRSWLAAWLASPLFKACMIKLPPRSLANL